MAIAVASDLYDLVTSLVGEEHIQTLGPGAIELWIDDTVSGLYSRDRSRKRYVDLAANTTSKLPIAGTALQAALLDWANTGGFVYHVEYPLGERPKNTVDSDEWGFYPEEVEASLITDLEFYSLVPATTVRVRYFVKHRPALQSPTGLTATVVGTAGTTVYTYRVSAVDASGETLACASVSVSTGNATLTTANYVKLDWIGSPEATSHKVYRTVADGTSPTTTGVISTLTAPTVTLNDTGLAGGGQSVPQANSTRSTVPKVDLGAVAFASAASCYERLAGKKIGNRQTGLHASGVQHGSQRSEFSAQAVAWRKLYHQHIHPDDTEIEAACVMSQGIPQSSSGSPFLYNMYNKRKFQRVRIVG